MLALLAAWLLLAEAAPARLPPVDHCAADPSFVHFRAQLSSAIAARSVPRLMALVADDVRTDQAGGTGKARLEREWRLDRGARGLWQVMDDALARGCAIDGAMFVAPSFRAQYDDPRDPYTIMLVRPGTPLRAAADRRAKVLMMLDWHTVEAMYDDPPGDGWMRVRLSNGVVGFVATSRLRALFEPQLEFEKRGGRWLIAGVRSVE